MYCTIKPGHKYVLMMQICVVINCVTVKFLKILNNFIYTKENKRQCM